jgi:ribonuclease HII
MSKYLTCSDPLNIEVGLDEAGRGPLIGRVYVGAVIWPKDLEYELIKDSKKMTAKKREIARIWIEENVEYYSVAYSNQKEIDKYNILQATQNAMHAALDDVYNKKKFDYILVDGNYFREYKNIDNVCVPKGDTLYYSMAAASILAKTYHDEYIRDLCEKHPELDERYNLLKNMGYGTKAHIEGIKKYGYTKYHRKSFKLKAL